ncbi:MAG: hypothetical protein AAGD35_03705 [Actinomycetota bacterium]
MPAWLLVSQGFLAVGWLRAAVAHGMTPEWWNGEEVTTFAAERAGDALPFYRPVLEMVAEQPALVAAVVMLLQLVAGVMLAFNVRPLTGLAVGAVLNVNFVMAGAVNPSLFYLAIALAIVLARAEEGLSFTDVRAFSVPVTAVALAAVVALVPFIGTLDPTEAIDDPALALIFIALLSVAAAWVVRLRVDRAPPPDVAPHGRRAVAAAPAMRPGGFASGAAATRGAADVGPTVTGPGHPGTVGSPGAGSAPFEPAPTAQHLQLPALLAEYGAQQSSNRRRKNAAAGRSSTLGSIAAGTAIALVVATVALLAFGLVRVIDEEGGAGADELRTSVMTEP